MESLLFCWLDNVDLQASTDDPNKRGDGPIASAVDSEERAFTQIYILNSRGPVGVAYGNWLRSRRTKAIVRLVDARIASPADYGGIYREASRIVSDARAEHGESARSTFHLSVGSHAMVATWIILSKTTFPSAELIQTSPEKGVEAPVIPFDIHAEFLGRAFNPSERALRPASPKFGDLFFRSEQMEKVVEQARNAAQYPAAILIMGESGTGKELLAAAIHGESPRKSRPFVQVNCGAIPHELIESEFFGHVKGAFTGAIADHQGYFERASGGTLLLDEIGELPPDAQVRLLRALQDQKIRPVGGKEPKQLDVRVIAATNRDLIEQVGLGKFRDDLFYRLAVCVLRLPPLREREGDLNLLIEKLLEKINEKIAKAVKLTPKARTALSQHSWPGNVRELENTLWRLVVDARHGVIDGPDVKNALFVWKRAGGPLFERPLDEAFNLDDLVRAVKRHYIERALAEESTNKTKAAARLGYDSRQRLDQAMKALAMERPSRKRRRT